MSIHKHLEEIKKMVPIIISENKKNNQYIIDAVTKISKIISDKKIIGRCR